MARVRRESPQTLRVLTALAARPGRWSYGYELSREVRLKAGSLYPILTRLADRSVLETRWEEPRRDGRPPRHLYRLTGEGLAVAIALVLPSATPYPPPTASGKGGEDFQESSLPIAGRGGERVPLPSIVGTQPSGSICQAATPVQAHPKRTAGDC